MGIEKVTCVGRKKIHFESSIGGAKSSIDYLGTERAMLWNASAINGYAIEASDGTLGAVSDLLFDDVGWAVRWLVVDTGNWLSGRKVLLPISRLGQPNTARRDFPVKLTMQQVKDSPDIDTDRPVSRQFEAHTYEYFGGEPYGGAGLYPISTDIAVPFFRRLRHQMQNRTIRIAPTLSTSRLIHICAASQQSADMISTPPMAI